MKKSILIITVCFVCAIVFTVIGICQNGEEKAKAPSSTVAASVKVNNTICPVMGTPVNMKNPVTIEYNGKIYNLCCSRCPAMFRANPEKYSRIAEEQAKSVNK